MAAIMIQKMMISCVLLSVTSVPKGKASHSGPNLCLFSTNPSGSPPRKVKSNTHLVCATVNSLFSPFKHGECAEYRLDDKEEGGEHAEYMKDEDRPDTSPLYLIR